LTKQDRDEMMVGSREQTLAQSELKERKRNPADFALWKGAPESETGWPSPWGFGRPGWHLECSTMIKHVLGDTIDMHGGGEDLLFPHHENEIAQSEALHEKPLARFWVHNSFVQVNSEKMSKSLSNFTTIRELLKGYTADELRLFILQTHYRNPIDFSVDGLNSAKAAMQRIIRAVSGELSIAGNGRSPLAPEEARFSEGVSAHELNDPETRKFQAEFMACMDNDFNTAMAVALLFGLVDQIANAKNKEGQKLLVSRLRSYAGVLGFTLEDTRHNLKAETARQLMSLLLNLRSESRKRNDYSTSDLIRKHLLNCGVTVMDTAQGSTWETS